MLRMLLLCSSMVVFTGYEDLTYFMVVFIGPPYWTYEAIAWLCTSLVEISKTFGAQTPPEQRDVATDVRKASATPMVNGQTM